MHKEKGVWTQLNDVSTCQAADTFHAVAQISDGMISCRSTVGHQSKSYRYKLELYQVISYKDWYGGRSEVVPVQVGTVSSNQLQGFGWRSL